jgi:CPA2 family monovalent cation:H+ antiporter-2
LALGAFLAGIMLGETEFRHQIEADIRPFRDVLLGLFFVTIGMLVEPGVLAANWYTVIAVAAGMMVVKATLVYGLVRVAGDENPIALRTALTIAQGGEFGFAAMSLALASGLIESPTGQILIAAIVISMVLAPFFIGHGERITRSVLADHPPASGQEVAATVSQEANPITGHVVICGFGRTGQDIARFLSAEDIPYRALDLEPMRLREAQAAGQPVSYGDATRPEILTAARVEQARLVVVTFTEPSATLRVLHQVREVAPDAPVVVRTRDDVWMERMEAAGATAVVPEVLEASLMLASQTLALLGLPMSRVFGYVRRVREDRYRLLRGYFHGGSPQDLEAPSRYREELKTVSLPAGAYAVGKRLGDLGLEAAGIEVQGIRRGDQQGPYPAPEVALVQNDILTLYGTPENLERAADALLSGW